MPAATEVAVARVEESSGLADHSFDGRFRNTSDDRGAESIDGLVARSMAARASSASPVGSTRASTTAIPETETQRSSNLVANPRSRFGGEEGRAGTGRSTSAERTGSNSSSAPRIAYRAATAPRPAAIRRSVLDDLPVAPIVLPPNREAGDTTQAARLGASTSSRADQSSAANQSGRPSRANRSASRSVNVRRSSSTSTSGSIRRSANSGGSDDAISADALARMIEHGFEPDLTRTVTRRMAGTTSSPVRRSPNGSGGSTSSSSGSTSSSAIIRRSKSGMASIAPGPIAIVGTVSGGSDSTDSSSGGVTTSQLLDLIDWINRVVDERLRLELERRGMTGGRW